MRRLKGRRWREYCDRLESKMFFVMKADLPILSVLMSAFNADQTERYTMLRRAKLKKETVRKVRHPRP